jgi:hypothetical protein
MEKKVKVILFSLMVCLLISSVTAATQVILPDVQLDQDQSGTYYIDFAGFTEAEQCSSISLTLTYNTTLVNVTRIWIDPDVPEPLWDLGYAGAFYNDRSPGEAYIGLINPGPFVVPEQTHYLRISFKAKQVNGTDAIRVTSASWTEFVDYSTSISHNFDVIDEGTTTVGTPPPEPVLTTIVVSPPTATLEVGETQQFTAVAYDQFGAVMAVDFTWTSSDAAVGTVSAAGLFTAVGAGDCGVTATSGAVSDTAEVTVTAPLPPEPLEVTVNFNPKTLNANANGVVAVFITFPAGCDLSCLDPSTIECAGAKGIGGEIFNSNTYLVKFSRADFTGLEPGMNIRVSVTGSVMVDGILNDFEGSDTIRVLSKGKK